jgi:hypothetical protein
LGHALSIAVVVGVLWFAQANLPERGLRYGAAAILFGFGVYRLVRSRHPRWVGMRVGFRDLTLWSFLMASAHGAGLMLVPILLRWQGVYSEHTDHTQHLSQIGGLSPQDLSGLNGPLQWLAAVVVHSSAHLLVALFVALLVYEKLGLALLRRAWFNLDLLWTIALVVSAAILLFV